MTTVQLEALERSLLSLPRENRAFLADRLINSLNDEQLSKIEASWVQEAERRYNDYKEGKTKPVALEDVLAAVAEITR